MTPTGGNPRHNNMELTMRKFAVSALVFGMVAMPAVASAQDQAAPAAAARSGARPKTNRDVILRTDLDAKASANLYDVVSSLRSHWLRSVASAATRTNMSIAAAPGASARMEAPDHDSKARVTGGNPTMVYVDGRKFGALASLRMMPAETAEKLCYFAVNRAQNRFGLAVETPVIEVFTRSSSYGESAC